METQNFFFKVFIVISNAYYCTMYIHSKIKKIIITQVPNFFIYSYVILYYLLVLCFVHIHHELKYTGYPTTYTNYHFSGIQIDSLKQLLLTTPSACYHISDDFLQDNLPSKFKFHENTLTAIWPPVVICNSQNVCIFDCRRS